MKQRNDNKAFDPIVFSSAIQSDELVSPFLQNLEHLNWKKELPKTAREIEDYFLLE